MGRVTPAAETAGCRIVGHRALCRTLQKHSKAAPTAAWRWVRVTHLTRRLDVLAMVTFSVDLGSAKTRLAAVTGATSTRGIPALTPTGATLGHRTAGRARPATTPGVHKLSFWHPPAPLEQLLPSASASPLSSFQVLQRWSCKLKLKLLNTCSFVSSSKRFPFELKKFNCKMVGGCLITNRAGSKALQIPNKTKLLK